jgi:hypothetical protein
VTETLELAGRVLATLDGSPPALLRAFAAGLELADGPASWFGRPVDCYADVLEDPDLRGAHACTVMALALRQAAVEGSLLARLADAEQPFWRAVSDALLAIAEERLPADGAA